MNTDHIVGLAVMFGAYGLTWYLLIISIRIVNRSTRQKPDNDSGGAA